MELCLRRKVSCGIVACCRYCESHGSSRVCHGKYGCDAVLEAVCEASLAALRSSQPSLQASAFLRTHQQHHSFDLVSPLLQPLQCYSHAIRNSQSSDRHPICLQLPAPGTLPSTAAVSLSSQHPPLPPDPVSRIPAPQKHHQAGPHSLNHGATAPHYENTTTSRKHKKNKSTMPPPKHHPSTSTVKCKRARWTGKASMEKHMSNTS
jgi:hypothetical protein